MTNNGRTGTTKEIEIVGQGFFMNPRTMEEAIKCCEMLAKSDFVPKDFKDKPGNILAAIQMGMEVGLKPLQALQSIAVVNGRPSLWGDATVAIVMNSGTLEYLKEDWDDKTKTATCRGKRIGQSEIVHTFSMDDASRIELLQYRDGKQIRVKLSDRDMYKNYGKRMCQMRARAFVLRDGWADYLKGLAIREEVDDYSESEPNEPKKESLMPKAIETPSPAELPAPVTTLDKVSDTNPAKAMNTEPVASIEEIKGNGINVHSAYFSSSQKATRKIDGKIVPVFFLRDTDGRIFYTADENVKKEAGEFAGRGVLTKITFKTDEIGDKVVGLEEVSDAVEN